MTQDPLSSIVATEEQMLEGGWELIVGLEVHVELATKTKLFSGSPNHFGDEPNTNIDPVTLGLPGALPVLNKSAKSCVTAHDIDGDGDLDVVINNTNMEATLLENTLNESKQKKNYCLKI